MTSASRSPADFRHCMDDPHVDPGFTREPLSDTVDEGLMDALLLQLRRHRLTNGFPF
jgi:hypothetical protein